MGKGNRLDKLDQMKEHLEEARKVAAEIEDLPEIGYRVGTTSALKLNADLEAILKYVSNGCPNIYYADDWGPHVINPQRQEAIIERIDEMIGAVEMAKIQSTISDIAPDLVARLGK